MTKRGKSKVNKGIILKRTTESELVGREKKKKVGMESIIVGGSMTRKFQG